MGERKVLNKYYPPDFHPDKLPRREGPKVFRQFCIRTMAPFNMRCNTCGEFIYQGKKFNSRKETVRGENYLGLDIYRFYIRCTRCLAEITYKTDPEKTDYAIEHGATRNFEAEAILKKVEDDKLRKLEEELIQNPMKILENRTKESQMEMEILENLEELKELNARNYMIDQDALLHQHVSGTKKIVQVKKIAEDQSEDTLFKQLLEEQKHNIKRLADEDENDEITFNNIKKDSKENSKSIVNPKPITKRSKSILTTMVKPKQPTESNKINLLVSYQDGDSD